MLFLFLALNDDLLLNKNLDVFKKSIVFFQYQKSRAFEMFGSNRKEVSL